MAEMAEAAALKHNVRASFQPLPQLEVDQTGLDRDSGARGQSRGHRFQLRLSTPSTADPLHHRWTRSFNSNTMGTVAKLHRPLAADQQSDQGTAVLAQRFMDPASDWARRCNPRGGAPTAAEASHGDEHGRFPNPHP